MPTLNEVGTFRFDTNVELTKEEKIWIKTKKAIDIIKLIIAKKLSTQKYKDKVYFLQGRTGSGKSTLMVSSLYEEFIKSTYKKLICTEPRVVLTISNANDVVRYSKTLKLGENIGILTGAEKILCKQRDSMFYCTPQILNDELLNMLIKSNENKLIFRYKIIIIDEVHVLDLPMISLLRVIRDFLTKYSSQTECPVFIFTSATIDIDSMVSYFFTESEKPEIYKSSTMIGYVEGSSNFKVDEKFIDAQTMTQYISNEIKGESCYNIIGRYYVNHLLQTPGDTLMFLPVVNGICMLAMFLKNNISRTNTPAFATLRGTTFEEILKWRDQNRNRKRVLILSFARDLSTGSDEVLSHPIEPDKEALEFEKKIILSTPVLETGKTISTLTVCIDMGLQTTMVCNPLVFVNGDMGNIKQIPVNISQVTQRKGRVGREKEGKFVHFYTQEAYGKFMENDMPATVNAYCLSPLILDNIQLLKMFKTKNNNFLSFKEKNTKSFMCDLVNENNYIYSISMDIMVRSIHDLISSGFYTIFGEIVEYRNSYKNAKLWLLYAQKLVYIDRMPLFDVLVLLLVNFRFLPNLLTPMDFDIKNLRVSLESIKKLADTDDVIDVDIINAIVKARNIITEVKYSRKINLFANMFI